jgi:regulator of protease activity HflC (stomatin/prohibitin superfamily)
MTQTVVVIGLLLLIVLFVVWAARAIRIIRPYEKGVVERLGRYRITHDPGLHVIMPGLDRLSKVDMRENVVDVPPQEVITDDNVVVTVESLTSREKINVALRQILDDATDKWGVRVVRVELQRIEPPVDVTEAMHRQMKAERDKRALILEAEGDRQAAISRAEGSKQSAILEAEGRATAIREVADAERFQREIVAEGEAKAIASVFAAIHQGDPTDDLLAVRYIDALKSIAHGDANKVFLPYEISGLMSSLGGIAELFRGTDAGVSTPKAMPHEAPGAGSPGHTSPGGVEA